MIRACLGLLAGVYALQLSSFAATSDLRDVALVAFIVAVALRRRSGFAWIFVGLSAFAFAAATRIATRLEPAYAGDSMIMQVRVVEFPAYRRQSAIFVAEPVDDTRHTGRIRLSWFEPPIAVRLGDIWQFELRLRRPRSSSNPGVFDGEAWLFRTGISATGYVVPGRRNHLRASRRYGPVDRFRQHFVDRLVKTIPQRDNAAVLAAISVGARHLVTADQWDRYAITGTSHLMAISGLHVGLSAAGGYGLAAILSAAFGRGNHHFRATVTALLVAAAYTLVSGLAVPSQRAMLMLALLAAAILGRRRPQPPRIIALTCCVLVLATPVATMAPGFKLSFAAVGILAWLARRQVSWPRRSVIARACRAVGRLAALQMSLLFGLLPLTVPAFGRLAIVAPPVNLVAVPVFSFVTVPFTLIAMLFDGPLQGAGDKLLFIAVCSLRVIEYLIVFAAETAAMDIVIPTVSGIAWLYLLLAIAWAVLPAAWPGRSIAPVCLLALMLHLPARPPARCVDVNVLDVGQGLAVFAQTRSHNLLYDTGPGFRGGGSAAETVLLPFLAARGVDRLDTLVVSHADLDHAGGFATLGAELTIGAVIAGEPLVDSDLRQRACTAGEYRQVDGVGLRFLHPGASKPQSGNDTSCVLIIEAGEHRLLLTGDIERPVESALVTNGMLPAVDVVVVPHHGSRTSSSLPFVRALSPDLAIVSAGFGNRWGFPKQDVVERWQVGGATVLDTAGSGAVSLRLCAESGMTRLRRQRFAQRRIWHE